MIQANQNKVLTGLELKWYKAYFKLVESAASNYDSQFDF
jgi:hypothetical protein